MRPHNARLSAFQGRSRQGGVIATLLALIVLVVTLLAVLAVMRSVDTANSVAGSMAFRQAAMQEAEIAYTDARAKFSYVPPATESNQSGGYYSTLQPASTARTDIPAVLYNISDDGSNYDSTKVVRVLNKSDGTTAIGDTVYYVIERICPPGTGVATAALCIVPGGAITGGTSSNNTSDPGIPFNTTGSAAAFRLTVRVDGPKNARAYVQTILR